METLKKNLTSPKGSALFCQAVIEPNTNFKPEGVYEAKIVLPEDSDEAQAFMKTLDELSEEAYKIETEELKPGQRKNVGTYLPYTYEEDEDGNTTGRVIFKSKANASFKNKKGNIVNINIPVFDAKGNKMDTEGVFIWNGSTVRFSAQALSFITNGKNREAGVTLRLKAFQIIELDGAGNSADEFGFQEEEGFVQEDNKGQADEGDAPFDADDGDF